MNTMELVRTVERAEPRSTSRHRPAPLFHSELIGPVRQAILSARQYLLSEQREDGTWIGVQTADASLASQFVLMRAYLGQEHSEHAQQAAESIFDQQLPGGGWSLAPNGRPDVSTSVQAYFALKLAGIDPSDERLSRARQVIRRLGGADAADVTTHFFFALLGQIDYDSCPAMPPEASMLNSCPPRLREPLSVVWSHRPVRDVGIERGVRELFVRRPEEWRRFSAGADGRRRPGLAVAPRLLLESLLRRCERRDWTPLRGRGLERAEARLLEQIQPRRIEQLSFHELLWYAIAVHTLGFSDDSAEARVIQRQLRELACDGSDGVFVGPRPRTSPLGDTAVVLRALRASGLPSDHPAVQRAIASLSQSRNLETPPELAELCEAGAMLGELTREEDETDDALPPAIEVRRGQRSDCDERQDIRAALRRMNDYLENLCDESWTRRHDAPDTTGMLLEALALCRNEQPAGVIRRAAESLRSAQCADGGWNGDDSSGRTHATALAIRGLVTAGIPAEDHAIMAAVNWLIVHQQPGGGWNNAATNEYDGRDAELALSDLDQPTSSGGQPTASHTAVALLTLVSAGKANHPAALRGVQFLVETQDADGRWLEPHFAVRDAATGRSCGNDLRSVAWPLLALSRWAVAATADRNGAANAIQLRLVNGSAGN